MTIVPVRACSTDETNLHFTHNAIFHVAGRQSPVGRGSVFGVDPVRTVQHHRSCAFHVQHQALPAWHRTVSQTVSWLVIKFECLPASKALFVVVSRRLPSVF